MLLLLQLQQQVPCSACQPRDVVLQLLNSLCCCCGFATCHSELSDSSLPALPQFMCCISQLHLQLRQLPWQWA